MNTNKNSLINFQEIKGDLFANALPHESLAHCISKDIRMGAGIALQFVKKYGGVQELKAQRKNVGEVAYLKRDDRYIFYLITKEIVYDCPEKGDFICSLHCLRGLCEQLGVSVICMPRIGTGLDKLPLDFVHASVKEIFKGSDIVIKMYYI
ncbi:3156_t:CDS:1 [Ambispora leptoticha]|uniref:ADP-ribose 1''-phosphate phosphatase n=1 Tax=Ambispora leptoticha TaxID=144679 RepID=A0A9N8W6C7_9GLOM|nr:3156_t:CDS:1 [Ambispora leptoticha]